MGQKEPPKLVLQRTYEIPNTSIRAIETDGDSGLWFAGSNGKYGRITQGRLAVDSLSYEGQSPSFRALGVNEGKAFALSIENPALLFRLGDPEDEKKGQLVYKEEHPGVFYDSMTFLNAKDGIAMGDPTEGCLSILLTDDGGETWTKKPCSDMPGTAAGEAAFAASDSNIAVFEETIWIATGGSKARIFRSQDKGRTWEVFDTPLVQGKPMTGIYSVDFASANQGIIMGGNWEDKAYNINTKAFTRDGGKSWHLISEGSEPGYISCVQFVPETAGEEIVAASTEGVFYSLDAGKSWILLSPEGFYSLRFEDGEHLWLSRPNEIVRAELIRK